jgi:hypothetical protein
MGSGSLVSGWALSAEPDAAPRARATPGLDALVWATVGLTGALAAYLTVHSLRWPLVHDGPLMHYVAARLLEGAVPYRDLFDMNWPGVYLAHALALLVLGRGDGAFRAFDLAILAGTAGGLVVALRPFGRRGAAAAVALFWLYHLAGGAWRAGQRDLLLCLPLAGLAGVAVADAARPRRWTLGLAAGALGTAVWIKPHAALLVPLVAWLAWRRPPAERGAAAGVAVLGLVLPAASVLAWLAVIGALPAFLDIVRGYLLPLYSRLGREPLLGALAGHRHGVLTLGALGAWALGGAVAAARARPGDPRLAVLGAGLLYGVLHFVLQGKGWEYHLYPLALFASALGGAGLDAALHAGRRGLIAALLAALWLATGGLAAKGLPELEAAWIGEKHARALAVARTLAPLVAGGGSVQVFDTTEGGVDALYRLGARQPTRFLYDFHFYHDVGHPYVRRLRGELVAGLRERPPAAVVLFERGWPRGDYGRLREFPELAAWLDAGYRVTTEGSGYRIYAARRDR